MVSLESKWADFDVDDEFNEDYGPGALTGFESAVDKDGIKTIINYSKNDRGQTIKITRKLKLTYKNTRVYKGAQERYNMEQFGNLVRSILFI